MISAIRKFYRRVRSYILRKWFKVPVAGEKIKAGQPVYIDEQNYIRPLPPINFGKSVGLATEQGDESEPIKIVTSGTYTVQPPPDKKLFLKPGETPMPRLELLGYADERIEIGWLVEVARIAGEGQRRLRPAQAGIVTAEKTLLLHGDLQTRIYGMAWNHAEVGESVWGVKYGD